MTMILKNEDFIHLLTGRTPLNMDRLLSYHLKEEQIPLSREQWSVMAVLWKEDGCTQQRLADVTHRDRPGITRLLDNLQKEGFIERRAHETDRRTNRIFLTAKGKSVQGNVVRALTKTVEAATKNISNAQLSNLRKTFEQINNNIQNLEL